jgi:hypothetical protein
MKSIQSVLLAGTLLVLSTAASFAQEFPKPGPEHAWLQQFVGDWNADVEMLMDPTGKPPTKSKGTESIRPVGGFWILSENRGTLMGQPFLGVQTLGYDTKKQKYIGTWVDSVSSQMWQYEGSVDATGKTLTLESEGSCPIDPGKVIKAKDVIELQDKNHKTFKSFIQMDNGQWIPAMSIRYERKK